MKTRSNEYMVEKIKFTKEDKQKPVDKSGGE